MQQNNIYYSLEGQDIDYPICKKKIQKLFHNRLKGTWNENLVGVVLHQNKSSAAQNDKHNKLF